MFFVKTYDGHDRVLCAVSEKSFCLIVEPIFGDSLTIDLTGCSLDGTFYCFVVEEYELLAIGERFVSILNNSTIALRDCLGKFMVSFLMVLSLPQLGALTWVMCSYTRLLLRLSPSQRREAPLGEGY